MMDRQTYPVAPLLRELGRGKEGSRALSREQSRELMTAMLDGAVSDLELGGVLIALRMKGETAPEIAGFLDALNAHLICAAAPRPCVVLPTYNGARLLPNLVPLLALLLAQRGVPVLMHGQASEPSSTARARTRVTTLDMLTALNITACPTMEDVAVRWAQGEPAYVPLAVAAPGLSRLIALRRVLGVRNVAHTLAKLARPVRGPSLLLSCYTHPEFGCMLNELFTLTREAALSMRATEGEAVANARRLQRIERWVDGAMDVAVQEQDVAAGDVVLPALDASETAVWTRSVLAGERAVPAALQAQCDAIAASLEKLQ